MPRLSNREHLESLVPADVARSWPRPERRRLIILFTPRSGSSWLGDLLLSTRALGEPEEFLNQDINGDVVRRFGARTEIDYLNAIETETASATGVFSMEIIWGHLELSDIDVLDYYKEAHFVYLRRRDILAQAISLFLATETGVFHHPGAEASLEAPTAGRLAATPGTFDNIRRWWGHILNYECLAEVQLAVRGIRPLRLLYEDIVRDASGTAASILSLCGIPPETMTDARSSHKPVRGRVNEELARLFRAEQAAFIATMDSFRPPFQT